MRKEKGLIEDKDEFSMMVGNEKTLADRLGTSPDDIEKKLNAKRKGTYVTVRAVRNLCFCLLLICERCCIIVKVVVLICVGEVPSSEFAQGPGIMTKVSVVLLVLPIIH